MIYSHDNTALIPAINAARKDVTNRILHRMKISGELTAIKTDMGFNRNLLRNKPRFFPRLVLLSDQAYTTVSTYKNY